MNLQFYDKVERWPLERLIPHARNARTHSEEQVAQVAQIAGSIAEFGFVNPVLVGDDGVIVAGHGRVMAARKLGLSEAPVIVLSHLTPTQRRALMIADNQIATNAGWNDEMLAAELAALKEEAFDVDLLGFDDADLDRLLATQIEPADDADEPPTGGPRNGGSCCGSASAALKEPKFQSRTFAGKCSASWNGDRKQSTLWQIPAREGPGFAHSTQKPVECMKRPIENNSSPGQAVYEPFCGSGTAIIAAEITGRSCHAIELLPQYVDVAVARWQAFIGGVARLASDNRSFAEVAAERRPAAAS